MQTKLTYQDNVGVEMMLKMLQRKVAEEHPGYKLLNYSIKDHNGKRTITGIIERV
jgi:hypothetical protein